MLTAARRPASIALLLLCPAATSFAGYYFESQATVEGARTTVTHVRAWVDGPKAKIEFLDADATGTFGEGTYIIALADSNTTYFVNPKEETVAEIDIDQLFGMLNAVLDASAGMVQLSFRDFTNEKLEEGPGETILGYETMRYKFRTGYTMTFKVLGIGRDNQISNENEFWCTDDLDDAGFSAWLRPDRFRTGNAEMDNMIRQTYSEVNCLPLRSRVVSTTTGERGRTQTSTTLSEVTLLREESILGSTFEVPAGYATTTMPTLPQAGESAVEPAQAPEDEPRGPGRRLRDLLTR
jgi:hypothetical protein